MGAAATRPRIAPLAPLERAALLVITVAGLLLALVTPPFQVPDEPQHFGRSVLLSEGHAVAVRQGGLVGAPQPERLMRFTLDDFPYTDAGGFTRYGGANVRQALAGPIDPARRVFAQFPNVANYAPTLYAPQAVAIVVARAAGLSPLGMFLLARLVNLAVGLGLLWMAVWLMPFGRYAMLATAALPTFAYQAASVSPDATLNALGLLGIAVSLRLGAGGAGRAASWGLAPVAIALGLCKGIYAPLLLAGVDRRRAVALGLAFVLALVAFLAWNGHAGGDQPLYQVASRQTGAVVTTARLHDQLGVLIAHPLRYVAMLVSTEPQRSPIYLLQIVGRFGWGFVFLPLLAYAVAILGAAAGVAASWVPSLSWGRRAWWLALFAGIAVLVETALYLTGTPLGVDYVQGVQGRYFLPALPLLLLAFAPATSRPGRAASAARLQFGCTVLLQVAAIATVADAFWIHGFTSYHGLPPVHGAAGAARALLLPSSRW